jgi:hypothetical protein
MRYVRAVALIAALGLFAHWFDPETPQWLVEALWLGALGLWVRVVKDLSGGRLLDLHLERREVAPIVVVTVLLAAAWLPFYDNWRWAYTGDSVAWFDIGRAPAARHRLGMSLLSLRGVDENFTYLHGIAFNGLMFLFGPTLFWHRVGKLVVSCLSLTAIYAFFTLTLGRWWATAVVIGTAANYVWLWFSFVSYPHIDSFIFYFLSLTAGVLIARQPDRLGLWMACGLLGGLSLFFTQTAWSAVAAVGLGLAVFGLATRRFMPLAIYGLSFLVAAVPVVLQFSALLKMTTRQAKSVYDVAYLWRIFRTIITLAYDFSYSHIGIDGAFLRWPLGPLYVAGVVLAVLAVVPGLRRRLRLPAVAPVMVGLFLWDTVLMTLTNNGYGVPSSKRVYQLIPLQVFFALLPLYVVHAWSTRRRWLRRTAVGLVVAALATYAAANLWLIYSPAKTVYGVNLFDGLIELRQRFPDRRVAMFSSRDFLTQELAGDSFFTRTYHLNDTVSLERSFDAHALETACASRQVICFEPNFDKERFEGMRDSLQKELQPFELLNTQEMQCFQCGGQ